MIAIKNISKNFGAFKALAGVNLTIEKGELLALLGPSGCGKTTLMRIIAGLETVDHGAVLVEGRDITNFTPQARKIGFVFQHFALFGHMTVAENIAFGLKCLPSAKRLDKKEIAKKVSSLLKLIQMEWLADAFPAKLSGGQRQRVALARALAIEPDILLLDEPFSALDATVRRELRRWLKKLHDELHVTSIFVTHDQEEALEIASRVVIMNKGEIIQSGTPQEVYDHPANKFVYQFLGDANVFDGTLDGGQFDVAGSRFDSPTHSSIDTSKAIGFSRPDEIEITHESGTGFLPAMVVSVRSAGAVVRVELRRTNDGELVLAEVKRHTFNALNLHPNDHVYLNITSMKVFVDKGAYI